MFKKSMLISLVLCLVFVTVTFAENSASNEQATIGPMTNLVIDKKLSDLYESIKPYLKSIEKEQQLRAPAPPLTYLQVLAAASTQHPEWETFTENQLSSKADHGGAELYIVTVELGYGFSRFATMNGSSLRLMEEVTLDLDGDRIIDGFMCQWNASGYNSGKFTYKNTSTNSPWNTMSDSINIK